MDIQYRWWWLPPNFASQAPEVDLAITILHVFMAVFFAAWLIFFLYMLVRFRRRRQPIAEGGRRFVFPPYLEGGVAFFEILLLVVLSIPLFARLSRAPSTMEAKAMQVRVIAEQFAWNFHYPGPDGVFGLTKLELISSTNPIGLDRSDPAAKDDIVSINMMHVPVNRPIVVQLSSKDVVHSFAIPTLRVKQDIIPGMRGSVWFEATTVATVDIACAQLCGLGHYRMKGSLSIESTEDFDKWVQEELQILKEEESS